jgi:hypothetical protein
MPKLEEMRIQALSFVGKEHDEKEHIINLNIENLYALDYWYKTDTR